MRSRRTMAPAVLRGPAAEMPEHQPPAVAYHYFDGLSHAQTHDVIGDTAAAVRGAPADGP